MNLVYSPGSPEDLIDKKANLFVAQMTYPELVHFVLKNRNPQQAEELIRELGKRVCAKLVEYWEPKSNTVKGLINELLKFIWNGKFKYEVLEKNYKGYPLRLMLIDKDCKLCKIKDLPIFIGVVKEVHYCTAIAGFLEYLLNYKFHKNSMKFNCKLAEVKTVSSIGSGDDRCAHLATFHY